MTGKQNIENKETRGRKPIYTPEEAKQRKNEWIRNRKAVLREERKTKYLQELYTTIRKSKSFDSIKEQMMKLRIPK